MDKRAAKEATVWLIKTLLVSGAVVGVVLGTFWLAFNVNEYFAFLPVVPIIGAGWYAVYRTEISVERIRRAEQSHR